MISKISLDMTFSKLQSYFDIRMTECLNIFILLLLWWSRHQINDYVEKRRLGLRKCFNELVGIVGENTQLSRLSRKTFSRESCRLSSLKYKLLNILLTTICPADIFHHDRAFFFNRSRPWLLEDVCANF